MKNLLLISFLALATVASAQILRVNNTPGVNAPYTTIAAAVAAAGATDIIQVEGSVTSYGVVTLTKKVTLVGPGYFLDQNLGLQASALPAILNGLNFNAGSSGSSVSGFLVTNPTINTASNINFSNNAGYVSGIFNLNGSGTNISIRGNYEFYIDASASSYSNVLVANNYLSSMNTGVSSTFTVLNNIFHANNIVIKNSDVRNNIFAIALSSIAGSIFKNNVSTFAAFAGADPINVWNASFSSIYVGLAGNTTDTQWKLKTGSPAIGAGEGGIDCGMYGGITPYRPSGIQSGQPTITNVSIPASIPQSGTLNVKVSAKVN